MRRLASIFFVIAAAAAAEEPSAVSTPGPETKEDPIAAAARDFQSLKTTRNPLPSEKTGLNMSGLTTPEFQNAGHGVSVTPSVKPKIPPGAKSKSANWLVDGVMKKTGQSTLDKTVRGTDELSALDALADDPAQADPLTQAEQRSRTEQPKPSEAELNPLMRYMSGWMTSQDYALLRPGLAGAVSADAVARGDPSLPGATASGPAIAFGTNGLSAGLLHADVAPTSVVTVRENPFLQAFNPPPAPAPAAIASGAMEPAIAPPIRTVTPSAPPMTQPKMPEFARPSDDAKYFKQLKRF